MIQKIAVIGAGTMGNGIAQVFAIHHYDIVLCDVSAAALAKALKIIEENLHRMAKKELIQADNIPTVLSKIKTTESIEMAANGADLVIEAASENPTVKAGIFHKLDTFAPESCILATNTSSISITKLAAETKRPDKVIGMHFMNPVPVMKLVEVIRGYATSDEVCNAVMEMSEELGKIPVEVNDYPGFVANRILMPMINEAIYTLYEGVAGVSEIDNVMKLGMAHPMGPLALADFIGLDVCLSILGIMYEGFGNQKYAPCPLLVNMVTAGKLGKKTGEGFYTYATGQKEATVSAKFLKAQ
ncbi:MAG: 3-hydroxybutyryl-CoA dehydrogenase [Saprospiraceae bacterium]